MLLAPVPATGPVTLLQAVTPETPVMAQVVLAAVGATALVGPVTVAVKVMVPPSATLPAATSTATVGSALATVVVKPEAGVVAE